MAGEIYFGCLSRAYSSIDKLRSCTQKMPLETPDEVVNVAP